LAESDVSPDADLHGIVSFYVTVAHGLAVRAGDGATRADLTAASMERWPLGRRWPSRSELLANRVARAGFERAHRVAMSEQR
jgi:hypothetical protein